MSATYLSLDAACKELKCRLGRPTSTSDVLRAAGHAAIDIYCELAGHNLLGEYHGPSIDGHGDDVNEVIPDGIYQLTIDGGPPSRYLLALAKGGAWKLEDQPHEGITLFLPGDADDLGRPAWDVVEGAALPEQSDNFDPDAIPEHEHIFELEYVPPRWLPGADELRIGVSTLDALECRLAIDQAQKVKQRAEVSKAPPPIEHLPDRPLVLEWDYQFEKPNWDRWSKLDGAFLWEAACLAADIEPPQPGQKGIFCLSQLSVFPAAFDNVWDAVNRDAYISANVEPKPDSGRMMYPVRIDEFAHWALRKGFSLPAAMQERAMQYSAGQEEIEVRSHNGRVQLQASASETDAGRWPWGSHETQLLRKLGEAAETFWKRYDPTDPTTAPTNDQVRDWLTAQGVSKRTAEVMATILRADGLPTGPRTSA
ncbi:MAG: hypothetical protein EPN70_17530 [Paraburkholderia sp.]|uniref:hypothetical protein n=1 Tax=Paraburkholderia sp. TaxID=1926495 RepID=UPI00121690F9|nr:hypothetical protein [Paraburkholderia sp.]TAM02182.1 MAG: hypothetical protein EPN70_17530 [Paraburkholderia sp.]TAM28130.1 MAG: hypothetical protein EPN59_18390 [Paraburkholderia sp.]